MPLVRRTGRFASPLALALALVLPACSSDDPVSPVQVCDAASADTPVNLGALTGTRVSFEDAGRCASLAGAAARYLVVPQFATQFREPSETDYFVGNSGTAVAARVAARTAGAGPLRTARHSTAQSRLDARLRALEGTMAREAAMLARQREAAGQARLERLDGATASQFTTTRTFKTLANVFGTAFETVTATLKFQGTNIVIYVDNATPSGFTDEAIAALGPLFDRTLFPIGSVAFGGASDIDANGRIIVLMTPKVNALVSASECAEQGFITGYFFGFDLASTGTNSNRGEVFYTLVPDPTGQFSCAHAVDDVEQIVPATFIHELQHMISYNQHVLVRNGEEEDVWLNEGLSLIAEELASRYYEDRYPAPSGRTNPDQLFPDSAQGFITNNLIYAYNYLKESPDVSVTTFESSGTLEERGAAFLFLRWLLDQKGPDLARRLVQSNLTGIQNVAARAGEPFEALFGDFAIAVYTDSLPGVAREAIPQRYRFTSRNLRRLFARLHQIGAVGPQPFPIVPATLPPEGGATGAMVQGTMQHFILQSAEPAVPMHLVRPDKRGLDADLSPQVSIFRLP
jgi:hypothetical protein